MPLTLRDGLLPALDAIRAIPDYLGFRLHNVTVVQRVWSGQQIGDGTSTSTSFPLRVNKGANPVKVRLVSQKESVASGGVYSVEDLVVGPMTPPYPGSTADHTDPSIFDPPTGSQPTEFFFNVTGPGYRSEGEWFALREKHVDKPLRYTLILKKTGEQP